MQQEQILIVEDAWDTMELLTYNLRKANYAPLIARNGKEAIEAVRYCSPDLALLDVMMPELNGWDVCRLLRANARIKSIPIIMLTALSDEEARIKGLALGADDYLTKPFSVKELLLKIRKHIDRQRAMQQLQAREQEKETELRYLVHEMRNSLTVINGFSSLMLKDNEDLYLKRISNAAVHATNILDDASLLTRLEQGASPLPAEQVDLVPLMHEVVDLFRDTAEKKNLEIKVRGSALCPVQVNRTGIRQVLVNILSNAVKFSNEGGAVLVLFETQTNGIAVTVKDAGCGIPCNELPRIFDKFYRATGSELMQGAGLGLHIVKLFTDSMGGRISVASEQGAGSAFTVTFPLASAATLVPVLNVA